MKPSLDPPEYGTVSMIPADVVEAKKEVDRQLNLMLDAIQMRIVPEWKIEERGDWP